MMPTDKQLDFISDIEEYAPVAFTGNTKKEASEYIDKYRTCIPGENNINTWAIINGY